jgi:hypothetical protein
MLAKLWFMLKRKQLTLVSFGATLLRVMGSSKFRVICFFVSSELVNKAAAATGLRPAYIVVVGGLAVLGFLFFGFGAGFVV